MSAVSAELTCYNYVQSYLKQMWVKLGSGSVLLEHSKRPACISTNTHRVKHLFGKSLPSAISSPAHTVSDIRLTMNQCLVRLSRHSLELQPMQLQSGLTLPSDIRIQRGWLSAASH